MQAIQFNPSVLSALDEGPDRARTHSIYSTFAIRVALLYES